VPVTRKALIPSRLERRIESLNIMRKKAFLLIVLARLSVLGFIRKALRRALSLVLGMMVLKYIRAPFIRIKDA